MLQATTREEFSTCTYWIMQESFHSGLANGCCTMNFILLLWQALNRNSRKEFFAILVEKGSHHWTYGLRFSLGFYFWRKEEVTIVIFLHYLRASRSRGYVCVYNKRCHYTIASASNTARNDTCNIVRLQWNGNREIRKSRHMAGADDWMNQCICMESKEEIKVQGRKCGKERDHNDKMSRTPTGVSIVLFFL